MPAVSRLVRSAVPFIALVGAAGCSLPFLRGTSKPDLRTVAALVKPDSLRSLAAKTKDSLVDQAKGAKSSTPSTQLDTIAPKSHPATDYSKQAPAKPVAVKGDSTKRPVALKALDSTKVVLQPKKSDSAQVVPTAKGSDSAKQAPKASASDTAKASAFGKDRLDPSEISRDPNAWSDFSMAGDTTATRELLAVSRLLHRWYKAPVEPMRTAWPDLWGHVAELSLSRMVDTLGFAPGDPSALVLDLRGFPGLRKFRAPRVGLDRKRLVSIQVGSALEEIDLSGNRLEHLEIVSDGPSDLRRVDVSGNRLVSLRLSGVAPKVQASGNRLCSRLLGLPATERPDRSTCKDFPFQADSLARSLLERWSRSGLPGEIAPAKVPLVSDAHPVSLPTTRWTFPPGASRCPTPASEARFWSFGMVGYEGGDALLVGNFPALSKGRIRPGMGRSQVLAALGKPARSQGSVDAWASERTPDDRLWLGLRCFYDAEGRLDGVWIRKLPPECKS